MSACKSCYFYRPAALPSDVLAREIGTTDDQVNREINAIRQEEQRQAGFEAQEIRQKAIPRQPEWSAKPLAFDYCGLHEPQPSDRGVDAGPASKPIYLIPDIKNAGEQCGQHRPGKPEQRSCATCRHQRAPRGPDLDRQMRRMITNRLLMGDQTAQTLLQQQEALISTRKAREVRAVYSMRGRVDDEPLYFAHCRAPATNGEYVVGALENPHTRCIYWQP
jgi:hypothetical protein